jgi:GH24 family phage-related lysozyme (muramidase)
MATIPRLVSNRSLDPGGVVSYPSGDPVGQALEQAGNKGQSLVTHYFDRKNQQERFQSLIQFDEFGSQLTGEAQKAKETMEPGAIGLHDKLVETYDKRASEWLTKIPEGQRPEFEARIKAKRESFSLGAATMEAAESQRYQGVKIGERVETAKQGVLQGGPDQIEPFAKDVEEMINSSTLTPVQKDELRRSVKPTLEVAGFLSLHPEEKAKVAKGWGIDKGLSGTALDRTMQVLRDKEGFRSSTYWDVNAHRVGFGSDTITSADGSVRKVKQGDTVTRADAERDLARRSAEFLGGVKSSVGEEAFNKLNPNQQAALGSVAYNYGSLPASVATAARSGDTEALARSIEGLQGHNEGVNKDRRLAEAALVRSSGDGPVQGLHAPDPRFNNIPADQRPQLAGRAEIELNKQSAAEAARATEAYNNQYNALQTGIIDGTAGIADVQKARQDGWLKDAGDIMRVQGQIASRDKGLADVTAFGQAMADPSFPWNPVNKDHKDAADAGFRSLGGNMQALETIAGKTGIVPASAAVAMQGAMFSPDPKKVEGALQTAANLVGGRYPDIFAGATGGEKLTEAANTFRHYVYDRGMTAAEATKRIMEERTPEYEQKVKARIRSEDMNEVVKKNLKDSDIRGAFDPSFLGLAPNPALTFNPEMRVRAMGDYEEIFREKFAKNGDVTLSKNLALEEMKKTWGVTNVNGSKVVMKYPPERSPVYQGVENVSEQIAMQAVTAIKDLNGVDVDRSKIRLDEVKNTGERYVRGEPPTYVLSYTDKNGHVQTIPKQFYADPAAMRDAQTAARAAQSGKIQQRVEIEADMTDLSRANFGVR